MPGLSSQFFFFCFFNFLVCFLDAADFRPAPYALRISCGSHEDVNTPPTNTFWYKDFGYTGGLPANASWSSYIAPHLQTVRYFPLSDGPENCINGVPRGHYSIRIFWGLVAKPSIDNEPLFDVSIEGTLIYSLPSGWSNNDDERAFVEALVFLDEGTASLCFHSTGHGDPAALSIEILQVDDRSYYYGSEYDHKIVFRTVRRISVGSKTRKFDADYSGNHWGGDRFWNSITTFGQHSDAIMSSKSNIKQTSNPPNFYPEALYQTALVSTDSGLDLVYAMDIEPNKNYSIWLHFAEIDPIVKEVGQRVFDILINGDIAFRGIDIVKMAGDVNTALVLNKTIAINGRILTITIQPTRGRAIINAIEILEVKFAESKTLPEEVKALQKLKGALGPPSRLGWNGDPCVPQQHPWSGADCQYNITMQKWVIGGIGLENQGLRGFLPDEIYQLQHLQSVNLSGNSLRGPIPASIGKISSLEILDLSYNFFNGSIPESLGQMKSLSQLNLNGNLLTGRVPAELGGRLLHRASFNFTDNAGLCGIPGLPTCGHHLSKAGKIGVAFGVCLAVLFLVTCLRCWCKRRQNILRAQKMAARGTSYAKARTHFSHDVQMTLHHSHEQTRTAAEHGPSLLS